MRFLILFLFSVSINCYSQQTIDNRRFQTPVKNQENRGTCTAFGVAAMIELLPSVPADISEQYLYAALKYTQSDKPFQEGDMLVNYQNSLQKLGLIHEELMPYNGTNLNWESADTEFERLIRGAHSGPVSTLLASNHAKYGIAEDGIKHYDKEESFNPEVLKNLLKNGHKAIAVSYGIHLPTWSNYTNFSSSIKPTVSVELNGEEMSFHDAKKIYQGDLAKDALSGKVAASFDDFYRIDPETGEELLNYGGHVVTVVGFNQEGFIIKNSWGKDWGKAGYAIISYDTHKIFVNEMLLISKATLYKAPNRKKLSTLTDIRLKSSLTKIGNKNKFQLSLFVPDRLADANYASVTYEIFDANQNKITTKYSLGNTSITGNSFDNTGSAVTPFENENGDLTYLPGGILFDNETMVVKVTISDGSTEIVKTFNEVNYGTNEYKSSIIPRSIYRQ